MGEEPAEAAPGRFRAFISYSHADAKFAHWLHRSLENWRLPDKSRLAPVFIDRAELSAGSDLSAQVRDALAESAALVVVCSPNAVASRWVGQEIALFRELYPGRPVLAALIEGEPDQAFPDALVKSGETTLEPLAADFRKRHDGKRLGLLKLAAGLTALPLDRLVQRDVAARQRRVMGITAAALALVLVLSAALVIALRARAAAERQRAEAEGLVEFMLTDLRDKLRGTGDPKIMASVNQRALDYYSRMDVTALPDDSLDRRARVLHAMGEDNERLGNFPAAQKMYLEAWRITDEVLKRHPKDPDAIFAHAQSEFWVGKMAWEQGNLEVTGVHWREYLRRAEMLAKVQPGTKRAQIELGYANGNLCELIARQSGNARKAIEYCVRASSHFRSALNREPDNSSIALALANRLGWQADVELELGRTDSAIALRKEEADIVDTLLKADPYNKEYRERRQWPEIGLAVALMKAGKNAEAATIIRQCTVFYDGLASAHGDDVLISERRLRATWMTAMAMFASRSSEASVFAMKARELHGQLRRAHTPAQMVRFDRMMANLDKVEGEAR